MYYPHVFQWWLTDLGVEGSQKECFKSKLVEGDAEITSLCSYWNNCLSRQSSVSRHQANYIKL